MFKVIEKIMAAEKVFNVMMKKKDKKTSSSIRITKVKEFCNAAAART